MKNKAGKMRRKTEKRRGLNVFVCFSIVIFLIGLIGFISAEQGFCCEKTKSGAWCVNDVKEKCNPNFKISPTSCDSTSYCKPGCCFDSQEGLCMESTPQRVCSDKGGTWSNDSQCKISQCNLGCCVLGDQGAFVTLTRCKQLSGFYGLKTDFRSNINDEITCITTASGGDKGACVTEDAGTGAKQCTFGLRSSCKIGNIAGVAEASGGKNASVGFYKDILCSAEELGNICGMTTKTAMVEGRDEIYFVDSCGNNANIYDASRINDKQYWKKVYRKSESCGYGSSNANSKNCGNCDYYYGSIGKKASGVLGLGTPTYGNYICADLSCRKEGKQHGESWCESDSPSGNGQDTVGSKYYREVCVFGEVITEPCAEYRNEICVQGEFNGFSEAACRVNRWQDCLQQVEQGDCENGDIRDCLWIAGYYLSENTGQIEKSNNDSDKGELTPDGLCVPYYTPGFNFWGSSSGSSSTERFSDINGSGFGTGYVSPTSSATGSQCSTGNTKVTFKWEKVEKLWPFNINNDEVDWQCKENCQYVTKTRVDKDEDPRKYIDADAWARDMNSLCYKLGDCGGYVNWIGAYTDEGFAAYKDSQRIAGSGGSQIQEKEKTTTQTSGKSTAGNTGTSTGSSGNAGDVLSAVSSATSGTGNIIKDFFKSIFEGEVYSKQELNEDNLNVG
jgi:hypothetical protein